MQTYNNHLKYNWSGKKKRTSKDDIFNCDVGVCTQTPMDFRAECMRAADLMYQSTDKELVVHFSGGIDSEIICKSLIYCNHPFKVSIGKFRNDLNKHDIDYAFKFCKKYDIPFKVIDLNIIKWFETDWNPYRDEEFPNYNWSKAMHKYMMSKTKGYQIFGEGHVDLLYDPRNLESEKTIYFPSQVFKRSDWIEDTTLEARFYLIHFEYLLEVMSYMNINEIDGCPLFYMYTPELFISYIREYPNQKLLQGKVEWSKQFGISNYRLKQDITRKSWPELEPRIKYTGLEFIRDIAWDDNEKQSKIHKLGSPGNDVAFHKFEEYYKRIRGGF